MHTDRRRFLQRTVAGAASLGLTGLQSAPLGLPIGTQTYPIRDALGRDLDGTLRDIAGMGYQTIEMCSPQGYAKSGFGPLADMKAADLRRRIEAAGLRCESSHYTFRELKENLPERLEYARELGLKQIVLASFGLRNATMDDWARVAGELNGIASKIRESKMNCAFHNHDIEFSRLGNDLIYDTLLRELDPKLVGMQFQVAVVRLGVDAPALFEKHPGRFVSMHLQDFSPADKSMTAVGKGAVDWKRLFAAAKRAGLKNYFVELGREHMQDSIAYLRQLQV
jgi:sugar phosphate isomerase/epimerase